MSALGKGAVNGAAPLTAAFLCRVPPLALKRICRVPDKWPSAKWLFAVKFFSDGSLPRAVLGKAFAEGFWAFAECPGPRAPPVVNSLECQWAW